MRHLRHWLLPLVLVFAAVAMPRAGEAQVSVSITVAPPPLPVYVQPAIPGPGWIWAPGYWAWSPYGYYWVPGTWVRPPRVGFLWTPGYWGWVNGFYVWHAGYWGPHVGFYGGINYGFGYIGVGYVGGFWDRDGFHYNRAYNNFGNVHITNVYNKTVVNNINVTRVSFNGGEGGVTARPTAQEESFAHESHVAPTALQQRHENSARTNPALRASLNHGRPGIAATPRPAVFKGQGVVHAEGAAPMHPQPRPGVQGANVPGPHGPQPGHPEGQMQMQGDQRHKGPPHEGEPGGGGPPGQGGGGPDHPHP
ncbi:MAG: YXWGXW repeat-containing protein [Alphaproteobacteria bacterium]|nr:YXWGXW repeat-containing protein [Alphaproteobacteria bacterium]MDE1969113.1 YXWGXW repeat-containing protein [Alphaproteobacteria bacterium]